MFLDYSVICDNSSLILQGHSAFPRLNSGCGATRHSNIDCKPWLILFCKEKNINTPLTELFMSAAFSRTLNY